MSLQAEQLLRSALEKIVFFECRVEAMEAELDAARGAAARAQDESSRVRARLVELETNLAEARGGAADAVSKNEALIERLRLLEDERERFLAGFIEQARVAAAPATGVARRGERDGSGDGIDLGGFIAELRGEVQRLRAWKEAAQAAGIQVEEHGAPRSIADLRAEATATVSQVGERFDASGRIGLGEDDERRAQLLLPTRAERALYESAMHDLSSADATNRRRAADCLRALGSKAAAPLVAAALGREDDAEVKAALLSALAALAPHTSAAELALRETSDPRPRVRVAALTALTELQGERCIPTLISALGDASAVVRRRAVLCLGYFADAGAEDALCSALGDHDAGVARAAAVTLAGRASRRAQGALVRALDHRDPTVRKAAGEAVARWSGEAVSPRNDESERRRQVRRLTERLEAVDVGALRNDIMFAPSGGRVDAQPVAVSQRSPAEKHARQDAAPARPEAPAPGPEKQLVRADTGAATASSAEPARANLARGREPNAAVRAFERAVLEEVRIALRGCTPDDLAAALTVPRAEVVGALTRLVSLGSIVARGSRYYVG